MMTLDEGRLWAILDDIRNDVKDLCIRTAVIEADLENHLESQRTKFNKTTIVMGIVIGVIALVVSFK